LPPNVIDQQALAAMLRAHWGDHYGGSRRWQSTFDQIQRSVHVVRRHLALPVDAYYELDTFGKANAAWARVAPELGVIAARRALAAAHMSPNEIDHLFFVSGTGIATPSLDARIVNLLRMRQDVRRTPIFGLGCAAGVAAIGRAADVLCGSPNQIAMVVSVELCSLTFQRNDASIANIIASALFGDGAAAVILGGADVVSRAAAIATRVVATRSVFYHDTEPIMGWEVGEDGLKVVLSPAIPDLVRARLGTDVDAMLAEQGLDRSAIRRWVAHPGGNRVLEAIEQALELEPNALEASWRLLAETGNLSSASALFVLHDLLAGGAAQPGEYGMMLAMGPGFCAELALIRW
jgi:alkylresorcinol/alkylpyrone synthase